jgi:hypothetical protein
LEPPEHLALMKSPYCCLLPHACCLFDALRGINEILERKDINDEHQTMILEENAKRFYNL